MVLCDMSTVLYCFVLFWLLYNKYVEIADHCASCVVHSFIQWEWPPRWCVVVTCFGLSYWVNVYIHTLLGWDIGYFIAPPPPPQYLRIEISLLLYIISHVMIAYQICYKKYITFIFLRYASDLQDIIPLCSLSKYFNLALNIHRMCTYT